MPDLTFSQPARRSFTVPIVIALVVLGVVLGLVLLFTPHSTADATVKSTATYTSHLVYKSESMLVGGDRIEDDTYVLVTLRVEDKLRLPLFIKDLTGTFVPGSPEGAEPITTTAVQKLDVPNLYTTFPELKAVAEKQNSPLLLRETQIEPGKSAEGMVLVHFPVDAKGWNERKSAVVNIVLYHQDPIVVTIPK